MALSAKLQFKQSQSLVMTPQLMQSIRLLQLSHLELFQFIDREIEKNPLLELASDDRDNLQGHETHHEIDDNPTSQRKPDADDATNLVNGDLDVSSSVIEENLGTSIENSFDADMPAIAAHGPSTGLGAGGGSGAGGGFDDIDADGMEAFAARPQTLREVLREQIPGALKTPADRFIAEEIAGSVDEDGYLRRPLGEIAVALGADMEDVEAVLCVVQGFEPSGVAARNLSECLAIQLRELDRFDPAMQALVANLDLLAKRDFPQLTRICGVDQEDIADMVREIRALDPRPGSAFASDPVQAVVPDVLVSPRPDGSWTIELNPDALPRVLVNRTYYAEISRACRNEADKTFITECLQTASWLTKSLDQRAQTILKVATEIVRQQDMFLAFGIEHLRPLNLKTIAEAIKMHESTVSRVTANKYMMTDRGLFEMKFFFTSAISSTQGDETHSAESVRHQIRQMISMESAQNVLSDDAIVEALQQAGIEIARRTVAKYRESMNIPSSVQRRREKRAFVEKRAS
ncbi:MAG: RNA polymerase factor sigma-54 [Nitratireductor sp.]